MIEKTNSSTVGVWLFHLLESFYHRLFLLKTSLPITKKPSAKGY
ncbi:hypothetical protein HSIEG1_512 [Enterococcus sp. HSIEG1]|nr:hypothetical protein HSIEG1_512 [Enterococcus sp. HSIEG1]